jgi:hypothetical protein
MTTIRHAPFDAVLFTSELLPYDSRSRYMRWHVLHDHEVYPRSALGPIALILRVSRLTVTIQTGSIVTPVDR